MSAIFKKHLSRRTFLRGVGVTMSLPLLDAMVPARTALAQTAAKPNVRLGLCFIPHGAVMNQWTPAQTGALELSPILSPLAAHRRPQCTRLSCMVRKNCDSGCTFSSRSRSGKVGEMLARFSSA